MLAAETAMDPVVIRMDGCCDAIAAAVKMFIENGKLVRYQCPNNISNVGQ